MIYLISTQYILASRCIASNLSTSRLLIISQQADYHFSDNPICVVITLLITIHAILLEDYLDHEKKSFFFVCTRLI